MVARIIHDAILAGRDRPGAGGGSGSGLPGQDVLRDLLLAVTGFAAAGAPDWLLLAAGCG